MKKIILYFTFPALLLSLCGCKKPHPKPPTERVALTVRFFRSISSGDSAAAVRQGRKLYALAPEQDYILRLISIQESNDAVDNAQKLIRQGRINEALPVVAAAVKQYPHNRMLVSSYPQIIQLRNAEKLLAAMARAKNASAMRGARIAAQAGLSRNITPELRNFIDDYRKKENAATEAERAKALAAEKLADADARKAAEAAKLRAADEKIFQRTTAEKSADGERARQEAGAVPFESKDKK